jgi:3-hydroxyacyl-[acyl-carrier-protein] dehydratase
MSTDTAAPPPGKPLLDVEGIMRLLPHRPPFLLVDRVIAFTPHQKLVAMKSVTMNEPFFVGHFPGAPTMPGVLILEALAQAAGLLAMMSLTPEQRSAKLTYLMGIDGARFRKPVVPGDRLELVVEVTKQKGPVWKQNGVALVDGQTVAEAEFMAMLADRVDA